MAFSVLCVFAGLLPLAWGYSSTAIPDSVCSTMMPSHGASPQTGTPPFEVTTDVTEYSAGQTITGKLPQCACMR